MEEKEFVIEARFKNKEDAQEFLDAVTYKEDDGTEEGSSIADKATITMLPYNVKYRLNDMVEELVLNLKLWWKSFFFII